MNSADSPLIRPRNPFERRLVQQVAAAKPASSVGVMEKPLPGGRSLTIPRARVNSAAPLGLTVGRSGTVAAATIAGVMPTIGGTALDAGTPPTLTIPTSGTQYVIASITGTHDITTDGLFARNLTSRAVAISVTTSAVTSSNITSIASGTAFILLLATFVNGVKTAQNGHGPITCNFYDDGTRTAKLNCEALYPD